MSLFTIKSWPALKIWADADGQDMVEFSLLVGFVTIAVAAAFPPIGASIESIFSKMVDVLALANA